MTIYLDFNDPKIYELRQNRYSFDRAMSLFAVERRYLH